MNRLILIGNGFDLAHNLRTSYTHFLTDYWRNVIDSLIIHKQNGIYTDFDNHQIKIKKVITVYTNIEEVLDYIRQNLSLISFKNKFLEGITKKQFFENWVDIEFEYFEQLKKVKTNSELLQKLNSDFNEIKSLLVKYLNNLDLEKIENNIRIKRDVGKLIYEEFKERDITNEVLNSDFHLYPKELLFLNFNYTYSESIYANKSEFQFSNKDEDIKVSTIHMHGTIEDETSNPVIFGYGDEIDEEYKELEKLNNTACLDYIKSIKYLDTDNYKRLIRFINSDYYQILIMGHSCGVSDRTLLNTIFEHKNCCSIKPYYHKIDRNNDNYTDLIKNISRNFHNKSKMRERVVNKTFTTPLT